MAGPQFIKYFPHVISALKDLGNSGTPAEVRELIAQKLNLSDAELNEQMSSGTSRFENQVAWAKFYLSKAGYIDASKRGVWALTESGIAASITDKETVKIFKEVHRQFKDKTVSEDNHDFEERSAPSESGLIGLADYRAELLETIRGLSPAGFERLCQRLLRESGFQQVEVTGRTGDGGIDGKGLLQVNPLLSIPVIFQSKKYKADNLISSSQIRDFRGAMLGRADRGIFITTSGFTAEARKEALREGVTQQIELVDSERLVMMFEKLELGLTPKTVYEVDRKFFEEFT